MALSTQAAVKAKRRAFSAAKVMGLGSSAEQVLSALFQELSQKKGNPDVQIVEAPAASTTDLVVADVACKLYGYFAKGGSTKRTTQWADHASSSGTPTTSIPVGVGEIVSYVWAQGAAYTNGLTFNESGASGANGFFIVGAA
jgi:hypothetical protein